jgi:sugar/nucleoside kinase (ribokinase family)
MRPVGPGPALLVIANPVRETTILLDSLPCQDPGTPLDPASLIPAALAVVHGVGGSCANTAIAAARQGLRVVLAGLAGDDDEGHRALAALGHAGVECRVRLLPGRATKRSWVLKESATDRTLVHIEVPVGAVPPLQAREVPGDLLASASSLHLDRASRTASDLVRACTRLGDAAPAISLDLHTHPHRPEARARLDALLPRLAWLQLSEDAALAWGRTHETGPALEDALNLLSSIVPRVVITRGALGALACETGGAPFSIPPIAAGPFVDSTGAGDAHAAALLVAWLRGVPFPEACRRAARAGADACRYLGANPGNS